MLTRNQLDRTIKALKQQEKALRRQVETLEELLTKQNINMNIEKALLRAERDIYRWEFEIVEIKEGIDLSSTLQNLEETIESEREKSKVREETKLIFIVVKKMKLNPK